MNVKTLQIHVSVLQALVIGIFMALVQKDPELMRDLVNDESFTNVATLPGLNQFPPGDVREVQETVDTILTPLRALFADNLPQA